MISFHKSCGRLAVILIACNFSMITPPERSAIPFCNCVLGAKGLKLMLWNCNHLSVFFLPSSLSDLIMLTLRLYLRQIHRIKSLSIYNVSFSLPCIVIKYRNVLPEKVSWMSITCTNLACASLRSVQSIWRSIQGLSIFCSNDFYEICYLILAKLQCWHFVILGP